MKKCITLLFFLFPLFLFSQDDTTAKIPQWLLDHWSFWMKNGGVWETDNSTYQSKDEPFEAYGMEYKWGIGQTSLTGRLYGIQEGLETGNFWQFLLFWDPGTKQARMIQTGGGGMVGQGEISFVGKGRTKSALSYTSPDGIAFKTGHETTMTGQEIRTQSFDILDGVWEKRRFYTWKPVVD